MRKILIFRSIFLVSILIGMVACGETKSDTTASAPAEITEKVFTATGDAGASFPVAKDNAYAALMEVAIRDLIGDSTFSANETTISDSFLGYQLGYKYVDDPSWENRTTDADGNMILTLEATVDLESLGEKLGKLGISTSGSSTSTTTASTSTSTSTSTATSSTSSTSSSSTTTETTYSMADVDVTALSVLVYYDPEGDWMENSRNADYADMAVSTLNSSLAALGLETKDQDVQDLLTEERTLLQESTAGSVGVGLLLADEVGAELYAEVEPSLTFSGSSAHAMLTVKVYVRTTGTLILETMKGGPEMTSSSRDASVKASMKEAVEKIMEELEPAIAEYITEGRDFFIRLQNVESYRDASSFSTAVTGVEDVVSINLDSYSGDDMVADYNIKYKGNPLDLLDTIMLFLMDKSGFEYFDLESVRGNELIFTM